MTLKIFTVEAGQFVITYFFSIGHNFVLNIAKIAMHQSINLLNMTVAETTIRLHRSTLLTCSDEIELLCFLS